MAMYAHDIHLSIARKKQMAERENSADHNAKRQEAMYKDEPKKPKKMAGGEVKGNEGSEKDDPRAVMHSRHKREREETHERHATDRKDMAKRHETDHEQLNARQEEELAATGDQAAAGPVQDQSGTAGANDAMGQGAAAAA
jgi:hypothetical protein